MTKFDLHFHSINSDGKNTQEEILGRAEELNLDLIVLTDHDTITEADFIDASRASRIDSYAGTEISARNYEGEKSLHLTCYAQSIGKEVEFILANTKTKKGEMIQAQLDKLIRMGFYIDKESFYSYCTARGRKKENINKHNIAEYVLQNEENRKIIFGILGREASVLEFFRMFLKEDGEYYEEYGARIDDYEPSIEVCGQLAQSHNAILSIAHPNFSFSRVGADEFLSLLPWYLERGVNAIEINSKATKKWLSVIYEAKRRYKLILSAGSDNHAIGKTDDKHGDFGELNPLLSPEQKSEILKGFRQYLDT